MRDEGDTNGGWLLAAHAGWWLTLAVGRDEHPEAFPSPVSLIPHPSSLIPHPPSLIPHPTMSRTTSAASSTSASVL